MTNAPFHLLPINGSTNILAIEHTVKCTGCIHIKYDYGGSIIATKRECSKIHHIQVFTNDIVSGNSFEAYGVGMLLWILVVDTVDPSSLKYDIGFDFDGAQGCGSIGGEVGITCPCSENDYTPLSRWRTALRRM